MIVNVYEREELTRRPRGEIDDSPTKYDHDPMSKGKGPKKTSTTMMHATPTGHPAELTMLWSLFFLLLRPSSCRYAMTTAMGDFHIL